MFKEKTGTVTAGNSSGITDGAAAMVVLAKEKAEALGVKPMARILGVAAAGVDPKIMGIGVVPATRKLLARLSLRLEDFDLIEVNEAFAAQVLACDRELHFARREAERQRRRDRDRSSDRRDRRPHLDDTAPRDGSARRPARPRHAVHQRRDGPRRRFRTHRMRN